MSKRKRAERLIGKTVESRYHGPAVVLAVEVRAVVRFGISGAALGLRLQFPPGKFGHKHGYIAWEQLNSRVRYEVVK